MAETAEVLDRYFDALVRAGVTISFADWDSLDAEAKAALLRARQSYRAETVAMLATAMAGRDGAAWVLKDADGGDEFLNLRIDAAMDRYAEKVGAK